MTRVPSSPSSQPRTASISHYSAEAVQAILSQALTLQAETTYTKTQLQEMAAELNVTPDTLEQAIADWHTQPVATRQPQERQSTRQPARHQQWLHFALGSVLMIGVDLATAGTLTWAIYPVMGWGISLLFGGCDRPCSRKSSS